MIVHCHFTSNIWWVFWSCLDPGFLYLDLCDRQEVFIYLIVFDIRRIELVDMSFPDPCPPFMVQSQHFVAGSDAIGVWPQVSMNNDQFDLPSQPFKRPRNSEDNQSNSLPCPPINSRMNLPNPPVNKGTSNIFYKTKMCTSFIAGMCSKGPDCKYAHGMEDMRQPPPNWQELAGLRGGEDRSSGHWDDDQKIIHKMKLCKKFYNGEECPYGDRCNFLHEDPAKFRDDSGRFRESSAISIGTSGSSLVHGGGSNHYDANRPLHSGSDAFRVNTKPYLKTKICNSWEKGQCHYGDKCHFAHGQAGTWLCFACHINSVILFRSPKLKFS